MRNSREKCRRIWNRSPREPPPRSDLLIYSQGTACRLYAVATITCRGASVGWFNCIKCSSSTNNINSHNRILIWTKIPRTGCVLLLDDGLLNVKDQLRNLTTDDLLCRRVNLEAWMMLRVRWWSGRIWWRWWLKLKLHEIRSERRKTCWKSEWAT